MGKAKTRVGCRICGKMYAQESTKSKHERLCEQWQKANKLAKNAVQK